MLRKKLIICIRSHAVKNSSKLPPPSCPPASGCPQTPSHHRGSSEPPHAGTRIPPLPPSGAPQMPSGLGTPWGSQTSSSPCRRTPQRTPLEHRGCCCSCRLLVRVQAASISSEVVAASQCLWSCCCLTCLVPPLSVDVAAYLCLCFLLPLLGATDNI